MPQYKVLVADNYHYGDPDEHYEHRIFDTLDAALAACRTIVETSLSELHAPGMSADELYHRYRLFGADPFIVTVGPAAPPNPHSPPGPTPSSRPSVFAADGRKRRASDLAARQLGIHGDFFTGSSIELDSTRAVTRGAAVRNTVLRSSKW
jgi:hypothetical protein